MMKWDGMTIKTHKLKIEPEYFQAIIDGSKPFEIRKNDRNYQVGDVLILREYDEKQRRYSGEQITRVVTYITDYQQRAGYVVMGLRR